MNASAQTNTDRPETHSRRMTARSKKKQYAIVAVFLLLAVAAGIAIGAGGAVIYFKDKRFRHPKPAEFAKEMTDRMAVVVNLSPEEREKVEALTLRRMEEVKRVRKEMFGRIREEFTGLSDDVDAILGPERAEKWSKDVKERTGRDRRPPPRDMQKDD